MYRFEFLGLMQRNVSKNDIRRGIRIPSEISKDLAYLCGIFAGDGSINYRRKKNEYSLKVVGNPKDEQEFYHKIIGPKFEIVFGIFPRMKYHDSKTTYGFSVYSKAIYLFLINIIGLPSGVKYDTLRIPVIFLEDKHLTMEFIRGVFDTDGSISFKKGSRKQNNYPSIDLTSKSPSFIREIAEFLKREEFAPSTLIDYIRKDTRLLHGFSMASSVYLNGHNNLKLWNEKGGFCSPKHLEKIRKHEGIIN